MKRPLLPALIAVTALLLGSLPSARAASPLPRRDTLRILAVGNSFSQDAIEQYLWELFDAAGQPVIIGNLYIGGCTLERHFRNSVLDLPDYAYRKVVNGVRTDTPGYTLARGLADEPWDCVSFQQASGFSGQYETYEPYLTALCAYVRTRVSSETVFLWHQTWSYAADATHGDFPRYGRDQQAMYQAIMGAARQAVQQHAIPIIVPCGTAIQNARQTRLGDRLNRDGFHLELTYGRYTAACTWFMTLTGLEESPYHPDSIDPATARLCQQAARDAVRRPYKTTRR